MRYESDKTRQNLIKDMQNKIVKVIKNKGEPMKREVVIILSYRVVVRNFINMIMIVEYRNIVNVI